MKSQENSVGPHPKVNWYLSLIRPTKTGIKPKVRKKYVRGRVHANQTINDERQRFFIFSV